MPGPWLLDRVRNIGELRVYAYPPFAIAQRCSIWPLDGQVLHFLISPLKLVFSGIHAKV